MGDISLSGYKTIETVTFSGTQTLASLADDEWTNLSDEEDNSTNKYAFMDLELYLTSEAWTGDDSVVEIYVVPSVDGTNYPTWSGNDTSDHSENLAHYVGSMPTSQTTEAQRLVMRDVPMPQGKFKFGVRNRTNIAFDASGNTLKYRPHQLAVA